MIRPAIHDDTAALAAIFSQAIAAASTRTSSGHQDAITRLISMPTGIVIVVIENDVLVGGIMGQAASTEAEIHDVAVCPNHRRQGLGSALVTAFQDAAFGAGSEEIFLEVRRSNIAARTLYTTAGMTAVGMRPSYYPDGEDAVVLRGAKP